MIARLVRLHTPGKITPQIPHREPVTELIFARPTFGSVVAFGTSICDGIGAGVPLRCTPACNLPAFQAFKMDPFGMEMTAAHARLIL